MEIRQLRAFVAIAETGTFTAGAARVHVTQAAISMQIRQLEIELRAQLFVVQAHPCVAGERATDAVGLHVVVAPLASRVPDVDAGVLHDAGDVAPRVADQMDDLEPQARCTCEVARTLMIARRVDEHAPTRLLEDRPSQAPCGCPGLRDAPANRRGLADRGVADSESAKTT